MTEFHPSPAITHTYVTYDAAIKESNKQIDSAFWEMGDFLSRMARQCTNPECMHLPRLCELSINPKFRLCPKCKSPIGLYRAQHVSFKAYIDDPDVGIKKSTCYKWIKLYDAFMPWFEAIANKVSQDEDLQKRKAAARDFICLIGYTKLCLVMIDLQKAKTIDDVMEILAKARVLSKKDLAEDNREKVRFIARSEYNKLRTQMYEIRDFLKAEDIPQAKFAAQVLVSKLKEFDLAMERENLERS